MHKKYSVGQGVIIDRMHGMKFAPAIIQEVNDDHLIVRTHIGQFVKVKDNDIVGTTE